MSVFSVYLHFSLGPVQRFVGQARRTRDLWSGSFILSYLMGNALHAAATPASDVIRPAHQTPVQIDPLFACIELAKRGQTVPDAQAQRFGTLPESFLIRFDTHAAAAAAATAAIDAVTGAWQSITDAVWDTYIASAKNRLEQIRWREDDAEKTLSLDDVYAIWEGQVAALWEINWVVSESDSWTELAKRKAWRTHIHPVQGGDHCTMMPDWQELSGFVRSHHREAQDDFWSVIRQQSTVGALNLRDDERLSAIAFTKRMFPVLNDARRGGSLIGWNLGARNWPSTSMMAAIPWLRKALTEDTSPFLSAFNELQRRLKPFAQVRRDEEVEGAKGETFTQFENLEKIARENELLALKMLDVDANFFYPSFIDKQYLIREDNPGLSWKDDITQEDKEAVLDALYDALTRLNDEVGEASPYYALLMMDGDNAGLTLSELSRSGSSGVKDFSERLLRFNIGVDNFVERHDGKTIYAGGEDVLAILPLDTALSAAQDLRNLYRDVFEEVTATISAGLVYAHARVGLQTVYQYASKLLKDVAKAKNGRDSIAVTAMNSGGAMWEYVSTWDAERPHYPAHQ